MMKLSLRAFKPATRRLFILFSVLLCIYGLSFLYRPTRAAAFSSSLILPQEVREVQEIVFSIPLTAEPVEMGNMTLSKEGTRFFLRTPNARYPVRQDIIERFFALLSTKQPFITVSKRVADYPSYGIDEKNAARISLVRKDKTILAELFFGMPDAAGTGRYVRTGRSLAIFLIDNGIEPFLTIAHPFWLDLQIYKSLFYGTGIQGLEYGHHSIMRNEENDAAFHALELFLQTYSCIGVYSAPPLQNSDTVRVRLNLGDGTLLVFSFSPLPDGDYVFFDSRSSNAYIISGYTCSQLVRHIEALLHCQTHPK